MAKDLMIRSSAEEFITFKVQEKDKGIQVRYENETLWMTQKAIAELFDVQRPAITKHLNNIFNENELDKNTVCSKMEHTAEDKKISQKELKKLIIHTERKNNKWEEMPSNITIDDIDEETLKKFIEKGNKKGRINYDYTNKEDILKRLNLIDNSGKIKNA